jgi:L-2-hydroxyglutarate oxidase LhgO
MSQRDVLVVGAGLVGLATARALHLQKPGLKIALLDKEADVARHQSGHNSGVLHSGVYYRPGSLKATLCTTGKRVLKAYADEHGIRVERRGKLIVALDESELPRLDELHRRAEANGATGLALLRGDEIREIEPNAVGVRALYVPETGVIDYRDVARVLAAELRAAGCELLLGHEVGTLESRSRSVVARGPFGGVEARYAITCAGLQSDRLARAAGADPQVRIVPFRGDYYTLVGESRSLVHGLLYPVPDPQFPFLGVHFTRRVDGGLIAGPNAVLALHREQYRRIAIRPRDAVDALAYGGVWRFVRSYPRMAAAEVWRDLSRRAFVKDMQRYVPNVRGEDARFGPSGIRAQAMAPDGSLPDDFLLLGTPRAMHVLNAPSPAATASLAIGEELARRAISGLLEN